MLLIFCFSLLYIFFIPPAPTLPHIIFKIIPMLLIISYAYLNMPINRMCGHYFLITGLIFSMIGDATLRWFLIGLSFFLIAHFIYIYAFSRFMQFKKKDLTVLVILIPYGLWMAYKLITALIEQGEYLMIAPVIIYILAILAMGLVAFLTQDYFLIIGASLFIISDSLLAWNMFISPIGFSGLLVMSTYYLAQFAIATSLKRLGQTYIISDLPAH